MIKQNKEVIDNLKTLQSARFAQAKKWSIALWAIEGGLLFFAIFLIFFPLDFFSNPTIVLFCALLTGYVRYKVDEYKANAEYIKRLNEFADGFDIIPSQHELASLEDSISEKSVNSVTNEIKEGVEYYTSEQPGARRALKNLAESAWFTWSLSKKCFHFLCAVLVLVLIMAYLLFSVYTEYAAKTENIKLGSHLVSAILLFIVSTGILHSCLGFCHFANECEEIKKDAFDMLEKPDIEKTDAIMLLSKYQLIRSQAPMIPTFMWKISRHRLNKIWSNANKK